MVSRESINSPEEAIPDWSVQNQVSSRIRFMTLATLCVALIILLAAGITTYQNMLQLSEARKLVVHTHEILGSIDALENALKDMETGQRGYLLTQRESYLIPYQQQVNQIPRLIASLRTIIGDSPRQQKRLADIEPVIKSKVDELNETIALQKTQGLKAAMGVVLSNIGNDYMTYIRKDLNAMNDYEKRLLAEHSVAAEQRARESKVRLVMLSTLGILLLLGAAYMVLHFMRTTQESQRKMLVQYACAKVLSEATSAQVITRVMSIICEYLGWDAAVFWILEKQTTVLHCTQFWSSPLSPTPQLEKAIKSSEFQIGQGLSGRVLQSGEPGWITDIVGDPTLPQTAATAAANDGLHTALAFPIIFDQEVIAVIALLSRKTRNFDRDLLDTLCSLGVQIGSFLDRIRVMYELQQNENELSEFFENAVVGIHWVGPDGIILRANKAELDLLGYRAAEYIGQPISRFHLDVDLIASIQLDLQNGQTLIAQEARLRCKDGSIKDVLLDINGFFENGKFIHSRCFTRDITERKNMDRRISEFYSAVSHELRTPLTSIRGALGLLEGGKAGELSAKAKHLITIGRAESERLVRLINDILDIKKIEAGKLELKTKRLHPAELVQQTIDLISGIAAESHIKIATTVTETRTIKGDEDRLIQVLTNLMSNAIKYSPADGTVTITATAGQSDMIRIAVSDNGPGIKQEDLHKLFGMFQQIDQSDSRAKGGSGLGLAISKAIVEQHGGKIGVDTKPGEGSTFWFELPLERTDAFIPHDYLLAKHYHHQVLLVEDDDNIAQVMGLALAHDGFDVRRASTIADAEVQIANTLFHAVILDIRLPDGNGLQLMEKLKAGAHTHSLPIIIVTASLPEPGKFSHSLFIDWITKPFEEQRLLRAVQLAVRGRLSGPARVLIVDDDETTREIIKQQLNSLGVQYLEAADGNEAIDLARKENPDLIILDLTLPVTDGFEVVTVLRHERAATTPLLVYTARDLDGSEKTALTLGLSAHLTKSCTTEKEFVSNVRQLLNGLVSDEPGQVPN